MFTGLFRRLSHGVWSGGGFTSCIKMRAGKGRRCGARKLLINYDTFVTYMYLPNRPNSLVNQ